jgi:hypothetical protein
MQRQMPSLGSRLHGNDDAEYDCLAICNVIRQGTAMEPDLLTARAKCSKIRQICASEADSESQGNTPTLPGYSKV